MTLDRRQFLTGATAGFTSLWLGCQSSPTRSSKSATIRDVDQQIVAQPSRDGAGVALRRSLGSRALPLLDPFLLLDEIHSADAADYMAGFPQHPHRGFETVSYVLRGGFAHRDSVGNHGLIADGGAQWMTAGRGIVHEEMPKPTTGPELWGLQLWVNLPAARKLIQPRYQDLGASAIPELDVTGARVRLVAGQLGSTRGPVDGIDIAPTMLDASLPAGATFRHDLPGEDTAFIYTLEGTAHVGPRAIPVPAGQLAALTPGTTVTAVSTDQPSRFLLIAGTPIREPVARRGPFVMNTEAELDEAFEDYRSGRLTL